MARRFAWCSPRRREGMRRRRRTDLENQNLPLLRELERIRNQVDALLQEDEPETKVESETSRDTREEGGQSNGQDCP